MDFFKLDPHTRDISPEVLDANGRLRVMPAEYWASTTPRERMAFGYRHGIYGFPTVELVECLRKVIDGRKAIEIGAGHGVLAEALGIPATDSRQQEQKKYREHYAALGQPTVPYGPNIVACSAYNAVRKYEPEVVIACWVTQQWVPAEPWFEGNEAGVDERDVINNCSTYIFVGNSKVHRAKRIWSLPHHVEYPPWIYSRVMNGTPDLLATWQQSTEDSK